MNDVIPWKREWPGPVGAIPRRGRRGGHGGERPSCGLCAGDGDACNPGNADPHRALVDWLPPVICPRCGGTGKDPKP